MRKYEVWLEAVPAKHSYSKHTRQGYNLYWQIISLMKLTGWVAGGLSKSMYNLPHGWSTFRKTAIMIMEVKLQREQCSINQVMSLIISLTLQGPKIHTHPVFGAFYKRFTTKRSLCHIQWGIRDSCRPLAISRICIVKYDGKPETGFEMVDCYLSLE